MTIGRPVDLLDLPYANGSQKSSILSVSDVERLAKAGIKVEFADISGRIRPDQVPQKHLFDNSLVEPLVHRWAGTRPAEFERGLLFPFSAYVARYGDKFYIFLVTGRHEPCILEDDAHLYPSDALMAKIHLLLETPGDTNGQGNQAGQARSPAGTTGPRAG